MESMPLLQKLFKSCTMLKKINFKNVVIFFKALSLILIDNGKPRTSAQCANDF